MSKMSNSQSLRIIASTLGEYGRMYGVLGNDKLCTDFVDMANKIDEIANIIAELPETQPDYREIFLLMREKLVHGIMPHQVVEQIDAILKGSE